jgi:hypothetical protein
MLKKLVFSIAIVFGLSQNILSQASISDNSVFISYLTINYGAFVPGGDLANRFGFTNYLGGSFTIKTENNMTYGISGAGYFGNDVRVPNLLHGMLNDKGNVLDDNAIVSTVLFLQRGYQITFEVGKIFHVGKVNPNSGIYLNLGLGYNSNWIRIENQKNTIPQLSKEAKKYYDRKVAGIMFTEYIGYQYFSNKGMANFTAGFEFMQGINSDFRTYNIDDKAAVDGNYLDLYFGIKVGWLILFRKTMSTAYYIN